MPNRKRKDIRNREKVIDVACGILIVPMFYVFTCLVFSL